MPLLMASSSDFGWTGMRINTPEFALGADTLYTTRSVALPNFSPVHCDSIFTTSPILAASLARFGHLLVNALKGRRTDADLSAIGIIEGSHHEDHQPEKSCDEPSHPEIGRAS